MNCSLTWLQNCDYIQEIHRWPIVYILCILSYRVVFISRSYAPPYIQSHSIVLCWAYTWMFLVTLSWTLQKQYSNDGIFQFLFSLARQNMFTPNMQVATQLAWVNIMHGYVFRGISHFKVSAYFPEDLLTVVFIPGILSDGIFFRLTYHIGTYYIWYLKLSILIFFMIIVITY